MYNKRILIGMTALLALGMNISTFANGSDLPQSVVIGVAPGGRVTSSVGKSESEVLAETNRKQSVLQSEASTKDLPTKESDVESQETGNVQSTQSSTRALPTTSVVASTTNSPIKESESTKASIAETQAKESVSTSTESKKASATTKVETTKAETTKAETTKAQTTKSETQKTTAATQAQTTTAPSTEAETVKAKANFKPARTALVGAANEAGPGVKATTVAETTAAESESDKIRKEMVGFALKHVGLRYRWGGANLAKGVDCSGLTSQIYKKFGISIGRTSRDQARNGRTVPLDAIKAGDLLIYTDERGYINHVTMYLGDNRLINASSENTGVIISDIGYRTPIKAVRFLPD